MTGEIRAKKHLGQNFLHNQHILEKIVGASSLEGKHIIEIGPGPGDLTATLLSRKPKKLDLIEIDDDMIALLNIRFSDKKEIRIYHSDVLKINIIPPITQTLDYKNNIPSEKYELYGNIPYYITSPIIHHFLYKVALKPEKMTLTMQKEVADRILMLDKKGSLLSLACHCMCTIEKVCDIHPGNFSPVPKVWSTCLRFSYEPKMNEEDIKNILRIAEVGFSHKRKKLASNLQNIYEKKYLEEVLERYHLSPSIRAEDLSVTEWTKLYQELKN